MKEKCGYHTHGQNTRTSLTRLTVDCILTWIVIPTDSRKDLYLQITDWQRDDWIFNQHMLQLDNSSVHKQPQLRVTQQRDTN